MRTGHDPLQMAEPPPAASPRSPSLYALSLGAVIAAPGLRLTLLAAWCMLVAMLARAAASTEDGAGRAFVAALVALVALGLAELGSGAPRLALATDAERSGDTTHEWRIAHEARRAATVASLVAAMCLVALMAAIAAGPRVRLLPFAASVVGLVLLRGLLWLGDGPPEASAMQHLPPRRTRT